MKLKIYDERKKEKEEGEVYFRTHVDPNGSFYVWKCDKFGNVQQRLFWVDDGTGDIFKCKEDNINEI